MTQQKRTREDIKKARQREQRKQKPPAKSWVKRLLLIAMIAAAAIFVGGAGLFAYYVSDAPELDEELLKDPISSEFYDKNGELFATVGIDENRKYVNYEDIPQDMVDAILATEDVRFFDHFGIDLWRLGGAVVANFRDGYGSQGASTITQQVVKNSFFSNEKRLKRKAQEAWLAIQLERKYSKEEIFEMYFNKVLMSGTIYGFGTAAEYFYGKELKDLTLDEMALLAGMPQSPNNYNPIKNPERAEKRRNTVLSLMVQHEKITAAEEAEAKSADVTAGLLPEEERKSTVATKYGAFLDVVLSEIEEKASYDILAEGIKVYTTLDPAAQAIVEDVMNDGDNFPNDKIQSGVSVIDTKTGAITAIGGGRNFANRGFNYAYDLTSRSPGSTIKPLVDYGPAFEYLKWSTGETLVDEPINYSRSNQVVTNWDSRYNGTMTLRKALYTSRNVPAVKTFREVTAEKAQQFLKNVGIKTDYLVESDALGGGRVNISPIQLAASYASFGNGGLYTDPYSITKIEYRDGSTEKFKPDTNVAMSDSTAYMVTDILRDTIRGKADSFAQAANVPGIDIAGKTGTTNYSRDEFDKFNLRSGSVPDTWFVGYSPHYSIAIWSGYEKRSEAITTWDERRLPQRLFKSIMSDLAENVPNTSFEQPSSVVSATIEVGTSPLKLASSNTPADKKSTELFIRGTVPTAVSDAYEAVELEAPFNVRTAYNETANSIDVSWSHNETITPNEEEAVTYSYEVSMKVDNEAPVIIQTSSAKNVIVPNVKKGSTYTFTIVAIDGDNRSTAASGTITIKGEEEAVDPVTPEQPTVPDGETPPIETPTEPTPETPVEDGGGDTTVTPPTTPTSPEEAQTN